MSRSKKKGFSYRQFASGANYQRIWTGDLFSLLPEILLLPPQAATILWDGALRPWFPEQPPDAEESLLSYAMLLPMGHEHEAHHMTSS